MRTLRPMRFITAAAIIVAVTAGFAGLSAVPANAASACESQMASEIAQQTNAERAARGLPAAQIFNATDAQAWAENLRSSGGFGHSGAYSAYGFVAYSENVVAIGPSSPSGVATTQFMGSQGHRAWMLSRTTDRVGVGVAHDPAHNRTVVVMHMGSSTMGAATQPHDSNPPGAPVVTNGGAGTACVAAPPPPPPPAPTYPPMPPVTGPPPVPYPDPVVPYPTPVTPGGGQPSTPAPGGGAPPTPGGVNPPKPGVRIEPGASQADPTTDTTAPSVNADGTPVEDPASADPSETVGGTAPAQGSGNWSVTTAAAALASETFEDASSSKDVAAGDRSSTGTVIAIVLTLMVLAIAAAVGPRVLSGRRATTSANGEPDPGEPVV